ncbi:MAG TPA: apolipoprotein N-acyltransferase [Bryobacteraceae bacterium]|nr:apolipoprotein N-acyltransferase [Bryobacteraceae bacterium]
MLNWILSLASALLLIFTFPRFHIVWFAPIALTPLLVAMTREARPARRFLLGWVSGVVYWFGVCYWIQFVLAFHGGMGDVAGWLVFLLFCVAKAVHMGAFGLVSGILMRRWWAVPAVSAAWVAIEVTHGPLGFAWLTLGNAGIDMGVPLRLAPLTGVYGLSFVFMMMATALALSAMQRPRRELLWLAPLPLLYLLPAMPAAENGKSTALLVQPNISETEEWTEQSVDRMERQQVALSARGALTGTDPSPSIVAWPEVPAPLYYYEDARFRNYVDTLARTIHAYLLVGIVAHRADGAPLNSAVLVSPEGVPLSRYDKVNLVPFGEFVPWPLGALTRKISTEAGDFAAGQRAVVSPAGDHHIATFICYESVFPNFVRKFAEGGAEVLFNISNDGWFGKSAARAQHLEIVRMRAAENRRWILRATNDGITATIDPAGRLRGTLPLYVEGTSYTGFSYISQRTMYTRWGDWFPWLCATILVMGLVADRVV